MTMDPRQNQLHRVILMTLAGSALVACATTSERTAETQEIVDLSGDWVINEELSDRPSDVLSGVGKQSSAATEILQSIGRSISVFGISVGQIAAMLPDNDDDEEATPEFPREITDPMGELRVVQASDSVEVDYDSLSTVVYRPGETVSDADQHFSARWQEGSLVVERQPTEGLASVETFELAADGERLIWTVTVETPAGDDVEIKRVYDARDEPVPPGSSNSARFAAGTPQQ
ncbi:MAG: hypothetical protein V3S94_00870 [Gammaproteobacteria bacterium]